MKGRRTQRLGAATKRCCLLAAIVSVCSRPNAFVSGLGLIGGSSTLGRSLAAAAATGAQAPRGRGLRRPRQQARGPAPVLSSERRPAFVGEASSAPSTNHWKDLGPEEERVLCEQIAEHKRIQNLQVELEERERRPVSVHEWAIAAGHPSAHQLMAALQEGRKAERTLLLCHQGLVRSVVFRYKRISRSLSSDDLMQEGNVGLLQAVSKFDPTKGTRFSSYAVFRIKASILRAIANKDRLVRVPVHAQDAAMRILATSHALQLETGSLPSDAQIALALSMPEENVSLYRESALPAHVEDLDNPVLQASVSEGRIRGQQWPWDASKLAQAEVVRRDMLRAMQSCLSPTEQRALRLRFGLEDGRGEGAGALTFKEIGRTMELSAEGIRQMVFRSIAKLQESDEASGLLLAYADLV